MRPMTVTSPQRTRPRWCAEYLDRERLLKGGFKLNAAEFPAADAVRVTVGGAGAAVDATTVPVAALSGAIPSGAVLDFGGKKFARLTAPAAAGAVSLTVAALPTALVANDVATFGGTGKKLVLSGTYVGRTRAERDANVGFGPAAAGDDERFLVAFTRDDVSVDNDVELVVPGTQVWENYLPGFAALSGALQTQLRADYVCSIGAD